MIESIRKKLADGKDMNQEDVIFFLEAAISGSISDSNKIEVLTLQNEKGISSDELLFSVLHLRKRTEEMDSLDICGTGGSGLPRMNTSTLAAFVLASMGIKVAKNGNRAATGRFGSFDLLESLGINIDLSQEQSEKVFQECGLSFFFAPNIYPEIGTFSTIRKALGVPTMFNLLGPLLSPLNPKRQIIGTSNSRNALLLAETAKKLGKKEFFIVVGEKGLDEVTLTGETKIWDRNGAGRSLFPKDFGLDPVDFTNISGGDSVKNTSIALQFLSGENVCSARASFVHMNVALALRLVGIQEDLKKGVEMSKDTVSQKKAQEMLETVKQLSHSV
jgi:anthranilate phosphoribosyltransferase